MIVSTILSVLCLPLYHLITVLAASQPPTIEILHQFPTGTRAENLCVLRNGSLLITILTSPSLYHIDTTSAPTTTVLVQSFPSHTSLLGITHVTPTTIAIIAGNISTATLETIPNSFTVYLLSLRDHKPAHILASFAIPDAQFLNGMTTAPSSRCLLLIADSTLGLIWRLNITTGAIEKAISDPIFEKKPGNPNPAINGIRVRGEYLYFSNSNTGVLGRLRITSSGERAVGARVEILARAGKGSTFDDFGVGRDGAVFVSVPTGFEVRRVAEGGGDGVFVDDGRIVHPSSVQLGRYGGDVVLYVTTDGALKGFGGEGGGQVVRVSS